ncbi:Ankyrin repeat domain-containing protein 17 [Cichlidogyrus casuarinus]|uniref:Ankyrin repeat domain-containing protein 17 n=1 Tax=Cichlidogyrus casuarinus TaxID=1844966 RepID=A0ABD2Q2B2_9PLAT
MTILRHPPLMHSSLQQRPVLIAPCYKEPLADSAFISDQEEDSNHVVSLQELVRRCGLCRDVILAAKEKQEVEAKRMAHFLLDEIAQEEEERANKAAQQAKKREKKRAKKKAQKQQQTVPPAPLPPPPSHKLPATRLPPSPPEEASDSEVAASKKNTEAKRDKHRNKKNQQREAKRHAKLASPMETEAAVVEQLAPAADEEDSYESEQEDWNAFIENHQFSASTVPPTAPPIAPVTEWRVAGPAKPASTVPVEEPKVKETANKRRLNLSISKHDIGKVIGQGGAVVSALRNMSGIQIDIESSRGEDLAERQVSLKGPSDIVSNLQEIIQALCSGSLAGNDVLVKHNWWKKPGKSFPITNLTVASLQAPLEQVGKKSKSSKTAVVSAVAVRPNANFAAVAATGVPSNGSPGKKSKTMDKVVSPTGPILDLLSISVTAASTTSQRGLLMEELSAFAEAEKGNFPPLASSHTSPLTVETCVSSLPVQTTPTSTAKTFDRAPGSERHRGVASALNSASGRLPIAADFLDPEASLALETEHVEVETPTKRAVLIEPPPVEVRMNFLRGFHDPLVQVTVGL